jgi:branched-chain amino acid aminotransferase
VTTRVHVDGRIGPPESAVVSVLDRGFLYGDSVYEVLRTAGGRTVDLDRHLARLGRSAAAIALPLPEPAAIRGAVAETLSAAGNPDSYIRIVVTRGGGPITLDISAATGPTLVVIVAPLVLPAPELYREGARVALVGVERTSRRAVDPAIKSGNYLNNVMALAEAKRSGAYEALMCGPDGRVAEGSTSNVFVVHGGRTATPALGSGLLPGITRQRVMEQAAGAGLPICEADLRPDDLRRADEVFITSSIRGIMPVTRLDEAPVGGGVPGPVTRRLMDLYAAFVEQVASGEEVP